jgi:hypothetical protein
MTMTSKGLRPAGFFYNFYEVPPQAWVKIYRFSTSKNAITKLKRIGFEKI